MALFPPGYMNAVVSLGRKSDNYQHIGTGFVYGHPVSTSENGTTSYNYFLVTNKHVVEKSITHVRYNRAVDSKTFVAPLNEEISGNWAYHQGGADIAIGKLVKEELSNGLLLGRSPYETELFYGGIGTVTGDEKYPHYQPAEGDGVFLIGFPFGLIGKEHNYPIVRHGSIARIQDWIHRHKDTYLIDAPAFPGNSGGPVIMKPETISIKGTNATKLSLLAVVISDQIDWNKIATSRTNQGEQFTFSQNTGLTVVVPIEKVAETCNQLS